MAFAHDLCDAPVSAHAWSKDGTLLAICPNTPQLLIYKVNGKNAPELLHTLAEHTQVISSVDFSPDGRIVTCSHDRNAHVWTFDAKANLWRPELVILRLDRAATYCRWASDGKQFVVATGGSKFRVCAFQPEHNWWQAYSYSHEKPTALTVDFLPDNQHVVCSTTDRHCRYFTLEESEASRKEKTDKAGKKKKVKEFCLAKWSAQGWVNASAVSPSGAWIALTSQDAYIRFIKKDEVLAKDPPTRAQNINGLPLLALAFLSETVLVGGGFDCQPRLFASRGDDWEDLGLIDTPDIRDSGQAAAAGKGMSARTLQFGGTGKAAASKGDGIHSNIILGIRVGKDFFSTCANDGRVGVWPFSALTKKFPGKVAL
jgi:actin related protein 2/3 complex subunit 1A/1B